MGKNRTKKLDDAVSKLTKVLKEDLFEFSKLCKTMKNPLNKGFYISHLCYELIKSFTEFSVSVCIVPRSKSESSYTVNQLLFKSTVQSVAKELNNLSDATDYLVRDTNTKTTHLPDNTPNYNNDGEEPYVGITNDTCTISDNVKDKDILLIDDIYQRCRY